MAFQSTDSGIAASVLLGLYTIYLGFTINIIRNEGFRTIYTSLVIYGLVRVTGQACGIVFAILGFDHSQWLIAYLVLGAEGYFVLVLTSYHLLANAQLYTVGTSWFRPSKAEIAERCEAATTEFEYLRARLSPACIFHLILIPANILVIIGGVELAGATNEPATHGKIQQARILRTVGQAIFLAQTAIAVAFAFWCRFGEKIKHINVIAILIVSPFILVRGIFGVLSIYLGKMDYFDMSNYNGSSIKGSFVAFEYALGTSMEFITAVVYISTYYISRSRKRAQEKTSQDLENVEVIDSSFSSEKYDSEHRG
ncbi:uncharacterized protein RJT20DRAFT_147677 [Scheffersomyces xylosifermentans]|uniref:uncharacterized protein n=1 Tax=Scheffersomyces xylosifermentans TaxID=1304137 RepID=UPI00315D3EC6